METDHHLHASSVKSPGRTFPVKRLFRILFQVRDHGLYCLFDSQTESYHDKKTLQADFQKALKALEGTDSGLQLLRKMEAVDSTDFSFPIINEIESIARDAVEAPEKKFLVDCFLATILHEVVSRARAIPPPSQLLNYLLYYFAEQQPEFLLLIDSFITVILNEERAFSRELIQRTAEVATLNYTPQILHIYTARNPLLTDKQKNTLFQALTAYEKIKRLLSLYHQSGPSGAITEEDFYQQRESKDAVARNWFGMSYAEVKSDQELFASAAVKQFIKRFISQVRHKQKDQAGRTARALVLSVNDEDTIRLMNDIINNDPECTLYRNDSTFINRAYRILHAVMQEYRRICEKNLEEERMHRIIGQMAMESRESLLQFLRAQYMSDSQSAGFQLQRACRTAQTYRDDQGRTGSAEQPQPPSRDDQAPDYAPLEETYRNLVRWSLMPLFEVYPISPEAQRLFNLLCTIGNLIPSGDRTGKLHFLLYIEKIVELLHQIESLGIHIIVPHGGAEPVIHNCFQLSTQGLVKKEDKNTYLISTGYWREHNKTRPGVFKIFGPCSMANCAGNYTVSLGLQILTSSGQFYAAPMALDHTLRYPHDYELQETCRDRPGWIPVRLPDVLRWKWEEVQRRQLATTNLLQIIEETIKKANDPAQKEFVPMGNIDGFWDA